ncbi:MAG: L-histidine N(alpha)-methyltransferase [Actinomycetota bacterium]|nr:L-histidine N(alpha)-methyltransferase [Actinomycetota bacterium]
MTGRFTMDVHLDPDFARLALRRDVAEGLSSPAKSLPPKWFYDEVGSHLFEEITRLPEYYPTRAETSILAAHARDIARESGADTLVELGSGSSTKTTLLLDALLSAGRLRRYVAFDVSATALDAAGRGLLERYEDLDVHGLVADFDHHLDLIPRTGSRMIAFLGGTIGNFEPRSRREFVRDLHATMRPQDTLLLGVDLVKSPDVLLPAYDDSQGVTAAFNRNVLTVINRELRADFVADDFEHVAVWDPDQEWIEMRLRALRSSVVTVSAIGLTVLFDAGEDLRTEISAKFRRDSLEAEMTDAGMRQCGWWTDDQERFAVTLWRAEPRARVPAAT